MLPTCLPFTLPTHTQHSGKNALDIYEFPPLYHLKKRRQLKLNAIN